MASGVFNTIYGTVAGGLIYGTRLFAGSLFNNSSKNQNSKGDDPATERKLNNHIEIASKKIKDWKLKYRVECEIVLSYGSNSSNETIEFTNETLVGGEDNGIFLKNLNIDNKIISHYEQLADNLEAEKISVVNEYGETLPYNYSKKLQDSCSGKKRIVLTYQTLNWNKKDHSFWLPKEEEGHSNRDLVFNYQERNLTQPLQKIKDWQTSSNCQIILVVDNTETIKINDIESNPYQYYGSTLFVRSGGSGDSKFDKLANDLTNTSLKLTNEYGESLTYDYSKKLKDACSGNSSITLTYQTLNWQVTGTKQQQSNSFWLPKEQKDSGNRSLVFDYQNRDYTTPLNKINNWKSKHNIENCEITLYLSDSESIKISEILSNPHKFLGSELFVQNIALTNGKKISKLEKLANDLAQERFEVLDKVGDKQDYNYSKKLQKSCQNNSITLSLSTVTWDSNGTQQSFSFWLPKGETDSRTLVFDYLDIKYKAPLEKIKKWKTQNNNCEITLFVNETESITVSEIENDPTSHLGSQLFARNIEDKDTGTRYSKFEKLANDLENKTIKVVNEYGETLDFNYSDKISDACNSSNNSLILNYREVKWNEKEDNKEEHKYSFWLPKSESSENNRIQIFNYLDRDYQTNLQFIQQWQSENENCEITLIVEPSLGNKETIKISDIETNLRKHLGSELFVRNLSSEIRDGASGKISRFERLAKDLKSQKFSLINKYGETLEYNYSKKLKKSCSTSNSLTLTYQEVKWNAEGKGEQTNHFWLPENEKDSDQRILIFNYQERDHITTLDKIKDWQKNNEECEITLVVSAQETISIKDISDNPFQHLGSELFVQNITKSGSKNISKFEKLAQDLENKNIKLTNEYGEELIYNYSEKIKDSCSSTKKLTLTYQEVTWTEKDNNQKHSHKFWLPKDESNNRTLVFNYQEREYKDTLEKIKSWQKTNDNCQITLVISTTETIDISQIESDPRKHLGSELFVKNLSPATRDKATADKISKLERLAKDLENKEIKLTNEYGEELIYNYSQKIKDACGNGKSITLTYKEVSWKANGNEEHKHTFWLPEATGSKPNRTLVFNYLDRNYKEHLEKIENWQKENGDCQITLKVSNSETIKISEISTNPYKHLGSELFVKNQTPEERDQISNGEKISKLERLAKDLEKKKIEVTDEYNEKVDYEYSEKIKDVCKETKSITLEFSQVSWTNEVNKETYKHSLWLPKGNTEAAEIFKYLARDITVSTKAITQWSTDNNCEIILTMSEESKWYAKMEDIEKDPRKYIGTKIFSKEISQVVLKDDGTFQTVRYSKMEKIVEDLYNKNIRVVDQESVTKIYNYHQLIKEACISNKNIINMLYYETYWDELKNNNKRHTIYGWFPEGIQGVDKLVFKYLEKIK